MQVSYDLAEYTGNVDAMGTLRLLDAIKTCGLEKKVKFFQASTSEMFGKVQEVPQKEGTPFYPRNPYGESFCGAGVWTNLHLRCCIPHGNFLTGVATAEMPLTFPIHTSISS